VDARRSVGDDLAEQRWRGVDMTDMSGAAAPPRTTASAMRVLVPFLIGAAVAVALGVYSKQHDPTGDNLFHLFFTGTIQMKVWFAALAFALAVFQLLSGLRIYGTINIPKRYPGWLGDAHRLSGTLALVATLPVGYHCLWALGYSDIDGRHLLHSLFGCLFYGAFVAKMIVVRDHKQPGWVLPLLGSVVFASLTILFLTSSLWFITMDPFNRPLF
jgi:hypothetical protein